VGTASAGHQQRNLPLRPHLRTRRSRNWFEVACDGTPPVPLIDLVRAVRSGKRYVEVNADTLAPISDALRQLLDPLARAAVLHQNKVEVPLGAVAAAPRDFAVLGPEAASFVAELESKWRQADEDAQQFAAAPFNLFPCQLAGTAWLLRTASWSTGALLADEMGVGKTRQVLAFLFARRALGPALVIAPAGLVREKWGHADGLSGPKGGGIYLGSSGLGMHVVRLADSETYGDDWGRRPRNVAVASYEYAARYADDLKKTRWATVVFDEGHYLKNTQAQRTRALLDVDAGFKIVVTGTPLENHVGEVWSIAQFFAPGLLGTQAEFRDRYGKPAVDGTQDERREVARDLAAAIAPFQLRRRLRDVERGMPKLDQVVVPVALAPEERAIYEEQRQQAERGVREVLAQLPETRQKFSALQLLGKLREVCACPGIHKESFSGPGTKIELLAEMVAANAAAGDQALVFSQWTRVLDRAEPVLAALGLRVARIDGTRSASERSMAQQRLRTGQLDVLLLTLGAGGVGLDLQAANHVYLLDPWWNPQREAQAIARAWRKLQDKPVVATRLIVADSVEEKMRKLAEDKADLFHNLMDTSDAAFGEAVTVREILQLVQR